MFSIIAFGIALVVAILGFRTARRFVRDRLRWVDGAHRPTAPIIAGIVALLVAVPVVALLPVVGIGTAIAFAVSVATGVAAGSQDVKSGRYEVLPPV